MDSTVLILVNVSFYIMMAALLLAFFRMILGPTCADRIVALDTMTTIGISLIALVAISSGRIIYLDVALVYALLSFLGGIVIARYMERGI